MAGACANGHEVWNATGEWVCRLGDAARPTSNVSKTTLQPQVDGAQQKLQDYFKDVHSTYARYMTVSNGESTTAFKQYWEAFMSQPVGA